MEKPNYQNQTYMIEEKNGKITKVEEATENQKKQKESLRKKSAKIALGVAIAAMTSLLATNPHVIEKENEIANEIATENTLSDEELDTISTLETSMKEYHQTAEESTQKEIMTEMSDFLSDKINNTTETTENTETVTLSRDELLQGLVDNGLTIDEANKQILAAEEKAANEQGIITESEHNYALENSNSIEEYNEIAKKLVEQYNDYESLDSNQVKTNNRDLLLQSLIDSGLTEEEAQQQILAAEEKSANEQGLHTEAEYNEMISAINQGISIEEQRELANQQLANYNDYENYYDDSNYTVDENTNSSGKVR